MAKRTREQVVQASIRLASEELLTLEQMTAATCTPLNILKRWCLSGRGGRHLDALEHPQRGLCSSLAAWARFNSSAVPSPEPALSTGPDRPA